jgi:hypothetical protein
MRHLVRSFQNHIGERGVHFYDATSCNFLGWREVFAFLNEMAEEDDDLFSERLADLLANYNPDSEYLAVHQNGTSVSVELFTDPARSIIRG